MSSEFDSADSRQAASRAILERLHKALAHDLLTPVGTISNYTAILEYQEDPNLDDCRAFAARIRESAVRLANMLQRLSEATHLFSSESARKEVDLAARLREILAQGRIQWRIPVHGVGLTKHVVFDEELLCFAWRAFIAFHGVSSQSPTFDLDIDVLPDERDVAVDLWIAPALRPKLPHATLDAFNCQTASALAPDAYLALSLATDLSRLRGGSLMLWGKQGEASGIRVSLPRAVGCDARPIV